MKKHLFLTLLFSVLALAATNDALGQSFSEIQGKWTLKKKSVRFGEATQTIEFKDQTFTYKVVSKEGNTLLFAKGNAKVEKLGPLSVIKLTDIEGGGSEADAKSVDDDRTIPYMTGEGTMTVAMNFDRRREGEEPESNTYTKVKN
jgi:hypothetical protein